MAQWYVDPGLQRFIDQWKAKHPGAVVGTIGDPFHRPPSSHLPEADGSVDAGDVMPGGSVTQAALDELAETLRANRDPRILYVIRRQRIFDTSGPDAWQWRPYDGDYHGHLHLNVGDAHEGKPVTDWDLTAPEGEDDMPTVDEIWAKRFREYVDEREDGDRDVRTVADILYAAHAAAVNAEQLAQQAVDDTALIREQLAEVLSRLPAAPPVDP